MSAPDSYGDAFAVTPHDTDVIHALALYVGGTGAVVVTPAGSDTDVTFSGVPAGETLPIEVKHVKATGTTATNIVGYRL